MSLEDQLSALVSAIEANTDAQLQLASAIRGQLATAPKADGAPTTGNAEAKPRGRPPKTPPPSPADLANKGQADLGNTENKAPADTGTKSSGTPGSAQGAGAGSGADGVSFTPEEAYKELALVVPEFAAKHGKAKAIGIFTEMGFTSGLDLKAKAPARIAEAVRLFRSAM